MAYVSFKTRKALGRRYGVDPALLLESERLQAEYSLAPGREARALQESQFARGMELQREGMKGAERGGMVGTAGNLLTTGLMINYLKSTPPALQARLVGWNPLNTGQITNVVTRTGVSLPGTTGMAAGAGELGAYSTGATQVVPGAFTPGGAVPFASQTGTFVVNPALMGEGAAGMTAGAAPAGAGAAPTAGAGMGAYAGPAAAAYIGSRMAGKALEGKSGFGDLSQTLRTPLTGVFRTGTEYLGNLTGIKEIGKVGREVSRIEEQLATGAESVIGATFGAVAGFVKNIFGW